MNRLLFKDATARDLGILRAAVFAVWFVIIVFTPSTNLALLPAEMYEPLGIFKIIFPDPESFTTQLVLSESFLLFMKSSLLLGTFLCMIGVRPFHRIAIPTVILLLLSEGIINGFNGYVNHAELGVLYGALILSLFPSADGFSVRKKNIKTKQNSDYPTPVLLTAFALCAAYSFIGIHRLLHGGLEQFYNDALFVHLTVNSFNYSKFSFTTGLLTVVSGYLLPVFKAGFFIVTLFEILSLFILMNSFFRYLWLAVIIPFHILSLFTMNIFFWENLIMIMILFIYIAKKNPQTN